MSVHGGGSHLTIAHDALNLTIQGPPPHSNLFNFDLSVQGPLWPWPRPHMVGKRAVRILLECVLVLMVNSDCSICMWYHRNDNDGACSYVCVENIKCLGESRLKIVIFIIYTIIILKEIICWEKLLNRTSSKLDVLFTERNSTTL